MPQTLPSLDKLPLTVLQDTVALCGSNGLPNPAELVSLRAVCHSLQEAADEDLFWRPFLPPPTVAPVCPGKAASFFAQRTAVLAPAQRTVIRFCYRHLPLPPTLQLPPTGSCYDTDRSLVESGALSLADVQWDMNDHAPTAYHLISLREWHDAAALSSKLLDDEAIGRSLINKQASNFALLSSGLRRSPSLLALACRLDPANARYVPSDARLTSPNPVNLHSDSVDATHEPVKTGWPLPTYIMWDTVMVRKGRRFGDILPGMVGQVVHVHPGKPNYYAIAIAEADLCDIWAEKHLSQAWPNRASHLNALERAAPKAHLMALAGFAVRTGHSDEEADVFSASQHASAQIRRQAARLPATFIDVPRGFARKHGRVYEQHARVKGPKGDTVELLTSWLCPADSKAPATTEMLLAMPVRILSTSEG